MLFHIIQFWDREKYGSQDNQYGRRAARTWLSTAISNPGYLIRENVKNACTRLDSAAEQLSTLRNLPAGPDVALDDAALTQYIAAEKSYIVEHPEQDRHRKRKELKLRASYIRSLKTFYALQ